MRVKTLIMSLKNLRVGESKVLNMLRNSIVSSNKFVIFILVTLAFVFLLASIAKACSLGFWVGYSDDSCQTAVNAFEWAYSSGCDQGVFIGNLYNFECLLTSCWCDGTREKWFPFGREVLVPADYQMPSIYYNGQTCKVRWGLLCESSFDGKYDASEDKCVQCSSYQQKKLLNVVRAMIPLLDANLLVEQVQDVMKNK